jgi:hypothetical protein
MVEKKTGGKKQQPASNVLFFVFSARFERYVSDDFVCVSVPVEPVPAGLSALFFAGSPAVEALDFPA